MAIPDESADVRIARLEERSRTQFSLLSEIKTTLLPDIKRDLEELKSRRVPMVKASALCSGVAAVAAVVALVKH